MVRILESGDLPALLDLYRILNPSDPVLDAAQAARIWTTILIRPGVVYFGSFDQEGMVSTCHLVVIPNLTRGGRPYAVIENVVTHPRARRRGEGRAVMLAALEYARSQDCYKVMLSTSQTDPGVHAFYSSLGFLPGVKTAYIYKF